MPAGFQSDPVREFAYNIEITAHMSAVIEANDHLRAQVQRALDAGCRSAVVAEHLGISRAKLYNWLSDGSCLTLSEAVAGRCAAS